MRRKLWWGLAIGAAMLGSVSAMAQTSRPLTIDEAIQLGLENSRTLHASEMKVAYSEARASEVNASRLPSVKLTGSYTRLSDIEPFSFTLPFGGPAPSTFVLSPSIPNSYAVRATLVEPLFTGFKLENSVKAANLTADATQADYTKDQMEFVYAVQNAYWSLFKAREVLKTVDENMATIAAHLQDAQNLMDQGLVTNNDVLKIQVQLSNAKLMQIDARNGVQIATVNLNSLIGLPLSTASDPASPVAHDQKPLEPLQSLLDRAVDTRPDVRAMDLRIQAGEAGVSAARGGWWPQVTLVGNYTTARPNPRIIPSQDIFKDTWDIGIQVSLDVWNWGTTAHQTAQAEAQLAQARDAMGTLRDGVVLEVTQSYLNAQQAQEKIGVARQTVEQAQENARITGDKYKEGLALTTDVLDADTALLQARTNYTQSLVDYELARARLRKSLGENVR